ALLAHGRDVDFQQQVRAALQVEAQVDAALGQPARQRRLLLGRQQVRIGEEHPEHERQDQKDDLPARQMDHAGAPDLSVRRGQALAGLESLAATPVRSRTWLIIDFTTRTFTPWAISTMASSFSTRVTLPIMPFDSTTVSLRFSAATMSRWALACFTCGRISRK